MNIELIEELAAYVDALPGTFRIDHGQYVPLDPPAGADEDTVIFDQGHYVQRGSCGTKACIAGSLALMTGDAPAEGERAPEGYTNWTMYVSRKLGISFDQADLLTDTVIDGLDDNMPTPAQAAQAIRNLIADPATDPWFGVERLAPADLIR